MTLLESSLVTGIGPDSRRERQIEADFRRLVRSSAFHCDGGAKKDPHRLLRLGYTPKSRIDLFDTTYYLTKPRQNPDLRFFVAYVVKPSAPGGSKSVYARIFYKDISLIWRVASHLVDSEGTFWIGKGDVRTELVDGYEIFHSVESTTDLPFEIQPALEVLNRRPRSVRHDTASLRLVLRRAPQNRVFAYRDFVEPRRRAAADPRNLIHGGKEVVSFRRRNDPSSLFIADGYEPDFYGGIVSKRSFGSSLYGGTITRYRVLSRNHQIQWLFFLAPRHAWIIPPQALTTELSSYGVRTIDVVVDDDAFVPGYEYHFLDDSVTPPVMHSQIPEGFVGPPAPGDDSRADASKWLDQLPVIQEFRRVVGKEK